MADNDSTGKPSSSIGTVFKFLLLLILIIIAVAVTVPFPNHNESKVANELAAISALKSNIFPAEIQFKYAGHLDQDGNQVGEYGLLSELSGRRACGTSPIGSLHYLTGQLQKGDTSYGYRFAVFLPDGKGGAISEPEDAGPRPNLVDGVQVKDAREQELHFVAYAWPISADTGRKMFAICADGQVRSLAWDGKPPAWNAVFGGQGWDKPPVWPPQK